MSEASQAALMLLLEVIADATRGGYGVAVAVAEEMTEGQPGALDRLLAGGLVVIGEPQLIGAPCFMATPQGVARATCWRATQDDQPPPPRQATVWVARDTERPAPAPSGREGG